MIYLYLQLLDMGSAGEFVPLSVYQFGYNDLSLVTDYRMVHDFGKEEDKKHVGLTRDETFREYLGKWEGWTWNQ